MAGARFDNFELITSDDPADEVLRLVAEVAAGGPASFLATGGSQAKLVYPRLFPAIATEPALAGVRLYLGDERVVPLGDPDSNTSMLDSIPGAPRGEGAIISPARSFAAELRDAAAQGGDPSREILQEMLDWWSKELVEAPRPRIVHLGLGPDGHVASIFPQPVDLTIATPECQVSLDATGLNRHLRLSVTMGYIDQAELVILGATGAAKGRVLKAVLEDPGAYPAGRLRPGRLVVAVDREAQAALA
ncbi:MAG: 6-phosphogluconolactonase [Actinomycetota bacterium]|nr:6-phosphogluconolactonase [Actinomycetota bacterium]MDA8209166.1 6-phosphogluconolactonase [Actinomycetota bacterium]